jgi:hypothetical protein
LVPMFALKYLREHVQMSNRIILREMEVSVMATQLCHAALPRWALCCNIIMIGVRPCVTLVPAPGLGCPGLPHRISFGATRAAQR